MNIVQSSFPVPLDGPSAPPFLRREDDHAREYIRNVQGIIRRRIVLIGALAACLTAVAVYFIGNITPLYSASAEILVEQAKPPMGGLASLSAGLQQDFYTNETEASVVRSLDLAKRVIAELNLDRNEWFNPAVMQTKRGSGGLVSTMIGNIRTAIFGEAEKTTDQAQERFSDVRIEDAVRSAYYDRLTVTASDRSRVLTIKFVAPDAQLAANIVNKLAEIYIRQQLEIRKKELSRESVWLADQSNESRERVIDSQKRLEQFRAKQGLSAASDVETLARQLAEYNGQLMQARVKRAEAEGRAQQALDAASTGTGLDSVQALLDSQALQRLRDQQSAASRKLADLELKLRPGHPDIQAARADLDKMNAAVAEEARKVVKNVSLNARLARDQEVAITAQIRDLRAEIAERAEAESSLRTLQVELKTNTQLYETLLNRLKEANTVDERVQQADARVISAASVAARPFYPNKPMLMVAAMIVATLVAMGIAFLLEFLDPGFRTLRQIETMTGLETAGMIMRIAGTDKAQRRPHLLVQQRANSAFAEAIRSVRVALTLRHAIREPLTLMVTSSVPGEGKTFSSVMLAASFAAAGSRVVLVDCDIRDPSVGERLGETDEPGLADYLHDEAPMEELVQLDKESGIHFIAGAKGRTDLDPPLLLSSQKMETLISSLKKHFDVVILDTPPIALFSDALLLQRWADQILFCVRWGTTPREVAMNAMKLVAQFKPHAVSVALTRIDARKQNQFDYAHPRYGSFEKYYARQPISAANLTSRRK